MAVGKDTIFERFLAPLMRLAIDEEALGRLYQGIDWETAADRYRQPDLVYPEYYSSRSRYVSVRNRPRRSSSAVMQARSLLPKQTSRNSPRLS
jgi:hypothetical protein